MEFAFLSLSLSLYPDLAAFVTRGGAEYGTMDKEGSRADGQDFLLYLERRVFVRADLEKEIT